MVSVELPQRAHGENLTFQPVAEEGDRRIEQTVHVERVHVLGRCVLAGERQMLRDEPPHIRGARVVQSYHASSHGTRIYAIGLYPGGVLTVGIDLAAEADNTAVAHISWHGGKATVTHLVTRADDDAVLDSIGQADKAGIDCPLGWPDAFVALVAEHKDGHLAPPAGGTGRDWRQTFTARLTDLEVQKQIRLVPLSVSADRIAHVALRCAGLLAQLSARGQPVDRSGSGTVVEIYPAAALHNWHLPYRGYKNASRPELLWALVDQLAARAGWLDLGEHAELCRASHDAADAVIAALAARAAALGLTDGPAADQYHAARTEGWIAVPRAGTLGQLC
jgi:predicted nuclease with RNAse H fold